jgi:putative copper export protein/mono/diheme cytochrome c family protein
MLNGAMPSFDLAEGGLLLAFVRNLSVMALFSAYGTLIFRVFVAPPAFDRMPADQVMPIDRRLRHLVWASLAIDAAALIAWLAIEAGILAEASSLSAALAAIGPVLRETIFGHVVLMQLAAALAVAVALGRGDSKLRRQIAAGIAVLATLLQAGHAHALAMERGPSLLLASDGLHLLSAGAWLGGLVPLLLVVREAPPKIGAIAARYFSPLGKLCLYGLVASAAYQAWELLGGIPGMVGTGYGWMALVKAMLFAVLFGFAWLNRYRFAPALRGEDCIAAKRVLIRSIALQTGFGLAIVIAAGLLSSLPPGLHTQPIWPFPVQPSLVTIQEDPGLRREVIGAVLALGGALFALALAIAIRRLRWPALAMAAAIIWFAAPHLALLFVEAHPTSFYRSPTNFAATAIAEGASLYPGQCAACHGAEGHGDGPNAGGLPEPPADLTAGHLWGHTDGELFWWLSHGIAAPNGKLAMPGFAAVLNEDQRWDLIDYIRARNAGLQHAAAGIWLPPIRAPDMAAACAGTRYATLTDLRGKVLRIVFADSDVKPPVLPQGGVDIVTITIPAEGGPMIPAAANCIATDPAIRVAYGVISNTPPAQLAGSEFLVDPNGWLRVMRRGEADGGSMTDPESMLAEIEQICRHPIETQGGSIGHHHHS